MSIAGISRELLIDVLLQSCVTEGGPGGPGGLVSLGASPDLGVGLEYLHLGPVYLF
jgi:hypothetical protein